MGKLVRDMDHNIKPDKSNVIRLTGQKYQQALMAKLDEESKEVETAILYMDIVEESGDVMEVLNALIKQGLIDRSFYDKKVSWLKSKCEAVGARWDEVQASMHAKHSERGGFDKGYYWEG